MTVEEVIKYFETAGDHYKISDDFVKKGYQQKERHGNYISEARQQDLKINAAKAEPNQKWHFLVSYIQFALDNKKNTMSLDSEFSLYYNKLKCPELLLWIAEAAGIDKNTVNKAATEAKQTIDNGTNGRARNSAGDKIRELIPWNDIEACIKTKHNLAKH